MRETYILDGRGGQIRTGSHIVREREWETYKLDGIVVVRFRLIFISARARDLLARWKSRGQIQAGSHVVQERVRETYKLDGSVMVRFRLAVMSYESERLTR